MKNLIELKNADTVLIEGNVIENIWAAGQQGYAIMLHAAESGAHRAVDASSRTSRMQHNVIRHVAAVLNILG